MKQTWKILAVGKKIWAKLKSRITAKGSSPDQTFNNDWYKLQS